MCQGPQVTTSCAATSQNARRPRKMVNRKLQAAGADVEIVDGAEVSKNLKGVVTTKAGPSATKAKERARAFQPSEQMSRLSLQQMSEAILARPFQTSDARASQPKIAADVEAILPNVSPTVLESTISVADVEAILPNVSSTVLESTISVAEVEATLPNVSSAVLESTISVPEVEAILPSVSSTVLESTISVADVEAILPNMSSTVLESTISVADVEASLPNVSSAVLESTISVEKLLLQFLKAKDTTKHSRRRVQFDDDACSVHEITPYAEIYGLHPREFVFGKDYCILPAARFADIGTALRRSMGVMDEEDSESDVDEFDASEWEEEYFIF